MTVNVVDNPTSEAATNPMSKPVRFVQKRENTAVEAISSATSNPSRTTKKTIVKNNEISKISCSIFLRILETVLSLKPLIRECNEKTTYAKKNPENVRR